MRGIGLASAAIQPGDIYVALPGTRTHGARYAAQAVVRGAVAVVTDSTGASLAGAVGVPVIVVDDPRATLATLAATLAGHPADQMTMLAVTGTNGKTTTVFALEALLAGVGLQVATIGTMGLRYAGQPWPWSTTTITTPEAPDLQAALAALVAQGCQAVAMEVSSHALAQHRVDAIPYAAAGFTNLGVDHLDFHKDVASYRAAKARLFEAERTRAAVIHVDDPVGHQLAETIAQRRGELVTVGRTPDPGLGRHLRIVSEVVGAGGFTQVGLAQGTTRWDFRLGLPGSHNVTDAALAVGLVWAAGFDPAAALDRLAAVTVPGRLQRIDLGPVAPLVYVDFAHTPQAVASTVAAINHGRTIVVVGSGGDRDPSKRALIGAAAVGQADVVIVTDDNPRSEDPALIRAQIIAGARAARAAAGRGTRAASCEIVDGGDRRQAIRRALAYAGPRDVVAVLGKGHETTQEIAGQQHPFADAVVIAEEWTAHKEQDSWSR